MKEVLRDKHYASNKKVKNAVMKWLTEQSSFWEKIVTMLRSRDVIHREPASFWYIPVSVIIIVRKKKALLFDLPLY